LIYFFITFSYEIYSKNFPFYYGGQNWLNNYNNSNNFNNTFMSDIQPFQSYNYLNRSGESENMNQNLVHKNNFKSISSFIYFIQILFTPILGKLFHFI
jgi:hypothetical protein